MSRCRFLISLSLTACLATSSIAATFTVSKEEAALGVACINAAQVANAGAAAGPLALRDALTTQAQEQLTKDANATTVTLDLSDEQANLLVGCIQSAAVPNVAAAEAPLALAQKIVTQYRAEQEKGQQGATPSNK